MIGRLFGRRRGSAPPALRLLSRPGCHLCEEMLAKVAPLAAEAGAPLAVVDVDGDPALAERWGMEIPVLLDETGTLVARAKDPLAKIRRRLLPS